MKSTHYTPKALVSLLALTIAGIWTTATACGPFYDLIPTPLYFTSDDTEESEFDLEKENLLLWQAETSPSIPLADIRAVVYEDDVWKFIGYNPEFPECCDITAHGNQFLAWINNMRRFDIIDLLSTAKDLEEYRREVNSPWYYPASEKEIYRPEDLAVIIENCENNKNSRLKERYALQGVRAYFASGQYDKCIRYYEENFAEVSDSNLLKRMAKRYAAGCWARLGEQDRANEYFAEIGDLSSIRDADPVAYVTHRNPDAPQLMRHILSNVGDTTLLLGLRPLATEIIQKKKAKNLGDWEFLLAYTSGHFRGDISDARRHIERAMRCKFSSESLRDHARAYRMAIDGDRGDRSRLIDDLRWIEEIIDPANPAAYEWSRLLQNIAYVHWLPTLLKRKDYATAVLLTGYAEHMKDSKCRTDGPNYGGLTFQIMNSFPSERLAAVKNSINNGSRLNRFLARYAWTGDDYLNELIGTIALREENYGRAASYLSKVSPDYIKSLNTYGYLSRDPFFNYPDRDVFNGYWEWATASSDQVRLNLPEANNPKLNFAYKMARLGRLTRTANDSDTRGLAALEYAIGVRNSFGESWALTQYWQGWPSTRFDPSLDYGEETFRPLGFLYSFGKDSYKRMQERYRRDVDTALASLTSDEARARAHLLLNNPKTIILKYPLTTAAGFIRRSCDHWRDWL